MALLNYHQNELEAKLFSVSSQCKRIQYFTPECRVPASPTHTHVHTQTVSNLRQKGRNIDISKRVSEERHVVSSRVVSIARYPKYIEILCCKDTAHFRIKIQTRNEQVEGGEGRIQRCSPRRLSRYSQYISASLAGGWHTVYGWVPQLLYVGVKWYQSSSSSIRMNIERNMHIGEGLDFHEVWTTAWIIMDRYVQGQHYINRIQIV